MIHQMYASLIYRASDLRHYEEAEAEISNLALQKTEEINFLSDATGVMTECDTLKIVGRFTFVNKDDELHFCENGIRSEDQENSTIRIAVSLLEESMLGNRIIDGKLFLLTPLLAVNKVVLVPYSTLKFQKYFDNSKTAFGFSAKGKLGTL